MSEKEYNLDIDPRILELLGPHLYTNIYYILGELIANAYDADAKNVYVIDRIDEENKLIVEDDGSGMSYENKDVKNFLSVAKESRTNAINSYTKLNNRRKMGRKGVGKLASLSVSENVNIKTIKDGEKSGFVLSRKVINKKLEAINEDTISFIKIKNHGTAIEMTNPTYKLPVHLSTMANNLLKIFPLVDETFRIHLIRGDKHEILEESQSALVRKMAVLTTLGEDYKKMNEFYNCDFKEQKNSLLKNKESKKIILNMLNKDNEEQDYTLEIKGWVGAYKTTREMKKNMQEFSDNFISLYANSKLGIFNILPIVGKNKLQEVYIAGQLHIDLFEETNLPDMALSNRQGYKSDDERYEKVLEYVKEELLPGILKDRSFYSELLKAGKKEKEIKQQKKKEEELKEKSIGFKRDVTREMTSEISKISTINKDEVESIVNTQVNKHMKSLGLKSTIDSNKRKVLISHTKADKKLADLIYIMLLKNGLSKDSILYSNCEDEEARIPAEMSIYGYLRDFFVDSISVEKIYVIYVTSENMRKSWGAIAEVGAGWITQTDHCIFTLNDFSPEAPLDVARQYQNTLRLGNDFYMDYTNLDMFCIWIENIGEKFGCKILSREENKAELKEVVCVVSSDELFELKQKCSTNAN
ncbi:TPA: ATP-binding protein [Listeria monocytogenes]|uniref:ATP-binding protein n=6 Tax=Listeria monocytogenes TaxID=1639 RepID=A0A2Z5C2A5_LISMN|nr:MULTISPECIES: ATP-binding protein [Listeria]EAF3077846.1 ATP-binding protein [Listeria monocytogenes serotype 1/2a]EKE4576390.1 ATP-binding protein [Listeria monocytogenes serotype 1/2b]MCZ21510.1 ATP-binding protein [Listeria monocytogenes serotype 4b]ALD11049.1 ATP-binding protein [Listeria monocytogenes J1-220]ALQ21563.1 histidine kinase [Listeria monocytogenes ATCC 19117]